MKQEIRLFKITDAGPKNNEDSCYVNQIDDRILACIADGVGGLNRGEIASRYITRAVESWFDENGEVLPTKTPDEVKTDLLELVNNIHEDLLSISEECNYRSFGSTIDVAILGNKKAFIAHVGDSRVYVFDGKQVTQVTSDQTVEEYEKTTGKRLDCSSSKEHTLLQCMGNGEISPYLYEIEIGTCVDVLMCTDGFSNTLSARDIQAELRKAQTGGEALATLVKQARDNGETDNITAVLIRRRSRKSKSVQ